MTVTSDATLVTLQVHGGGILFNAAVVHKEGARIAAIREDNTRETYDGAKSLTKKKPLIIRTHVQDVEIVVIDRRCLILYFSL